MVRVWRTTMDRSDTTAFRGRGYSCCYKPIAMIAVIAGIYVSIVSVLRFSRFLAGFNTALPSDNDLLPPGYRKLRICIVVMLYLVCYKPAELLIVIT